MRFKYLSVFLFTLLVVLPARAELRLTKRFSVDGEIRYRTELPNKDFLEATGYNEYSYLRSMLGFSFRTSRDVTLRFKLKESRVMGTTDPVSPSSAYLDMQESYLQADNLLGSSMTMRVGRFEMAYGRGMVMGARNWSNYGPNTYDGIKFEMDRENSWYHFAVAKVNEGSMNLIDPTLPQSLSDRYLGVVAASFADKMVQPIVMIDFDQELVGAQVDPNMVITAGLFGDHQMGKLKVLVDGYYQTGTYMDRDLASWMAGFDMDMNLGGGMRFKVGFGGDFTSGSTTADQADVTKSDNTFYAPFSARHAKYGALDFFQDVPNGLIDGYFRIGMVPFRRTAVEIIVHNFAFMNNMPSPASGYFDYSQAGQELDSRLRARLASGLDMTLGYSFFMPSDEFGYAMGGLPGQWSYLIYLQMTARL